MKLIGERIIIRDLTFKDEELFYKYGSNPNVGYNAGWKPFTSLEVARRVLSSYILSKESYAIALKENNNFIGTISVYDIGIRKYNKAKSLGFSLDEDYWGQGIMTEAVKLIIDYVFTSNYYTDIFKNVNYVENEILRDVVVEYFETSYNK